MERLSKTNWFSVKEKPVHVGWYEILYENDFCSLPCMRFWNGSKWMLSETEEENQELGDPLFNDKWRGLRHKQ